MQNLTAAQEIKTTVPKPVLSLASTPAALREVQRLRYKVFIETMGLAAPTSADGLGSDEFDAHPKYRDGSVAAVSRRPHRGGCQGADSAPDQGLTAF